MNFITLAFMIILAVGMFYGQAQYKKKRAEWGKTVTILCGILIIVTALWQNLCNLNTVDRGAIDRELAYQQAQCTYLGNYIKQTYGGSGSCLVILPPQTSQVSETSQKHRTSKLEALKQGLGPSISINAVPLKTIHPDNMEEMDMGMGVTAEDYNTLMESYPNTDLIIVLSPLPYGDDIYNIKFFSMIQDPDDKENFIRDPEYNYPTVGILSGHMSEEVKQLFADELLSGMTCWSDKPVIDEEAVPEDLTTAFNKRYLLITVANIDQVEKDHPKLFPKKKKK